MGIAQESPGQPDAGVFDQVWRIFRKQFYDRGMHGTDWKAARERHRPRAQRAQSQEEVREAVLGLLGELGASHASIIPPDVFDHHYESEGKGQLAPMFGLKMTRTDQGYFVSEVVHGGPAEAAGVRRGDRVVAIDGTSTDVAELQPVPHDPGLGGRRRYRIPTSAAGEEVEVELERYPRIKGLYEVRLTSALWNELEATRVSRRVHERYGFEVGYIRLYHVLSDDVARILARFLADELARADGVIVDLRGRGGLPRAVDRILRLFDPGARGGPLWGKEAVALIDGHTRSAKELLAFEWRRRGVGELAGTRSAGAVLGARFEPLRDGSYVLVPVVDMRATTGGVVLEGRGVAPDVVADPELPYARGRDAVLEAGLDAIFDGLLAERRAGRRHGWY